ncbi:phytoene desaturase family protein [Nocardia sp. NPDC059246]|uniref:phytoene desaturase family protein n=1 Tax=unclassified Nocardia TaxID=2637762 RepID=UPI0036CB5B50
MVDRTHRFDALVVGAGAAGLCAAARLTHLGYRTLVVERLDRVGGRASTHDLDGFKVNNGAIVIEVDGVTQRTFEEVGAKFDVRQPNPPILYRIGGKDVDVTSGGWGFLLSKLTRRGAQLAKGIGAARKDDGLPEEELSTAQWVAKYTNNEAVHGIFRNMCGSVFAVGSEELPARVFLTYFTRKSAFKKFGFCPDGTIGIWRSLADTIVAGGGEIWLSSEVRSLRVQDGAIAGAVIERETGERIEIGAAFAVSDIGPAATVELVGAEHFPEDYRELVRRGDRPCAMVTVNFANRTPLITAPGMLSFASTRRLCYIANFTETCPEMAPAGWHLYVGTSVPKPAVGSFDEVAEVSLLMQDLREQIPGFDDARILSTVITRDGWPPQRAVAGFDLPNTTPIANLWNVGDAVKEYANGGTTACAETAELVVRQIADRFPVQPAME